MSSASTPTPLKLADPTGLVVAGLRARFTNETSADIPALWQRFAPSLGRIPGQIGAAAYGVCFAAEPAGDAFDYLAGVEVDATAGVAEPLTRIVILPQRWAVFAHDDHVTKIRATVHRIFSEWLPGSGHAAADTPGQPTLLERYGQAFNPATGFGGMEIWIPLTR
jgi:AraC family transcriptional regulator